MNIQLVAENLRTTIRGKEEHLAKMQADIIKYDQTINYAVVKFLELNINELKVILFDVEKCLDKQEKPATIMTH